METRMPYQHAIRALDLAEHPRPWPWMIGGTPPLGNEVPGGDIDVICPIDEHGGFAAKLAGAFGDARDFHVWQRIGDERNVICRFHALGSDVEIFGYALPLERQKAVQHFEIERQLPERGGRAFADQVVAAKRSRLKTEPAFAYLLRLEGDLYDALLDLHEATDQELDTLLAASGFQGGCQGSARKRTVLNAETILPAGRNAIFVVRVWSTALGSPCPMLVDGSQLCDLCSILPKTSGFLNGHASILEVRNGLQILDALDDFLPRDAMPGVKGHLLAPSDLQVVKAAGVTFADSLLGRVIKKRAKGALEPADRIRRKLKAIVAEHLDAVVPGPTRRRGQVNLSGGRALFATSRGRRRPRWPHLHKRAAHVERRLRSGCRH